MAFNELNSEETHWKKVLDSYERQPSDRAKRLFQARLSAQPGRQPKSWFWGIAAGVALVGAWWMFFSSPELTTQPLASRTETVSSTGEGQVMPQGQWTEGKKESSIGFHQETQASKVRLPVSDPQRPSASRKMTSISLEQAAEQFFSEDDQELVPRLAFDVVPLRQKEVRIGAPSARPMEIAYVASVGTAESFKRNVGLGQIFDELMLLKYGEPVEERPVLAVLLSGEETSLLASERAELKERLSWIKEKVGK